MKDVSLDDLIKEDKTKAKFKRNNNNQNKKFGKRVTKNKPNNKNRAFASNNNGFQRNKNLNKNNSRNNQTKFNREVKPRLRLQRKPLNKPRVQSQVRKPQKTQEKGRTLKILGLHPEFSNEDLYKLFSAEGTLEKCSREQDDFGRQLPTAIVKYNNADAAKKAIDNLNQKTIKNSVMTVEPYKRNRN